MHVILRCADFLQFNASVILRAVQYTELICLVSCCTMSLDVWSAFVNIYLHRRRLSFYFSLFVCLSVFPSDNWKSCEIYWRGKAWQNDQVIKFWWRSRSRGPKSEIQILWIIEKVTNGFWWNFKESWGDHSAILFGGGLCSLSTSSL